MNIIKLLKSVILTLFVATLASCAITPSVTERETVNYDQNSETAGIIQYLPTGELEINISALARYNDYIAKYGTMFVPNLDHDFGITPLENGNYSLTKEGQEKWFQMKRFDQYQQRLKRGA